MKDIRLGLSLTFVIGYLTMFIFSVSFTPTMFELEIACEKPFNHRIDYIFPIKPVICFLHKGLDE